jgi:glyoxylase-like metal-dependent hydrolase (beta-lactamase superfamily II)
MISISSYAFDYKLKETKVNDTTWCFLGKTEAPSKQNGGFMSNSCYIKTDNAYIVVDTGPTFQFAKQAYKRMSKIAKLPVTTVINTHKHDDHWLGNGFYKETFNAKIYGPSLINTEYKAGDQTRMFKMLSKDAIKNTKIIKVDTIVSEITTLNIANTKVLIIPIGIKAHTSEDLIVYVPDNKILFSGDLVMNGRITANRHASVIGQLKALEMIHEKKWDNLVPGHGLNTSKTASKESLEYFTLLKKRVLLAIEDEVGVNNVTKVVKLEEFKNKALYGQLNKRNIFDAYRELEFFEEE